MQKERDLKVYEHNHLCICGETSTHRLHVDNGLSGTKAKGMCKCPVCKAEIYTKIYLNVK